jgi:precorrin isomerase
MSDFAEGTVHRAADDLKAAIRADADVLALWQGLTPLGRNEFICWVEDAKQAATRQRRIRRAIEEMQEDKRRPCCWPGCIHRDDKAPSPSQLFIASRKSVK